MKDIKFHDMAMNKFIVEIEGVNKENAESFIYERISRCARGYGFRHKKCNSSIDCKSCLSDDMKNFKVYKYERSERDLKDIRARIEYVVRR